MIGVMVLMLLLLYLICLFDLPSIFPELCSDYLELCKYYVAVEVAGTMKTLLLVLGINSQVCPKG